MATLKDIAAKTGLSTSSISRVLNKDDSLNISQEKKNLILKTAEELNYKTVQVRKKTDGMILVLSALTMHEEYNDPYYVKIRNGIESYCIKNKQKFKIQYVDQIKNIKFDKYVGVIVVGKLEKKYMGYIDALEFPVLFVDTNSQNQNYNCITVDLKNVTKIAIDKLIETGAEHILYVGPFSEDDEFDLRYTNFRMYMQLYEKQASFIKTSFNSIEVYNILVDEKQFPKVDAIFCANDNIALGVLKYLNEKNIKVPEQVQIIGVNDLPISANTNPKLTTVRIHSEYMGEVAVRRLNELLINESEHRMNYVTHSKLIERETTK